MYNCIDNYFLSNQTYVHVFKRSLNCWKIRWWIPIYPISYTIHAN